jgi:hypothetical protein
MKDAAHYAYHLSGRRMATILMLVVSAVMLAFVSRYVARNEAPWYFIVPVGLSAAMGLWAIIANPQAGSRLDADSLHFYNGAAQETIRIKDVASMKVTNWTDGPDSVTLTLKSGAVIDVPSLCADSTLAVALRDLGVAEV